MTKTCDRCQRRFSPHKRVGERQRFCSAKCRTSAERERYQLTSGLDVSRGTVGAISELAVSIDLLTKGYEVFRALSPSCSCDLLAMKDGEIVRVEVRSGWRNVDGEFGCAEPKSEYDLLAIVYRGEISYKAKK